MYAIITPCIFDLQVLGDLMMCTLFYDDQQEHKLEYKENIFNILVFTVWFSINYYVFLMYFFKCMVCTNAAPRFFYFLCMKYLVIDLHWR